MSRISDPALRVDILRNLVEEHGDFKESAFHKNTFLDFLRTLGADPGRLRTATIWPEVWAFNCVIAAACSLEEIGVGLGCLGLIELAFAGISASLGNGVLDRGWVKKAELVHYSLHAELDLLHADGFFAAAELSGRSLRGSGSYSTDSSSARMPSGGSTATSAGPRRVHRRAMGAAPTPPGPPGGAISRPLLPDAVASTMGQVRRTGRR